MPLRRRIFTVTLVILIGLVLSCFIFRNSILRWAFKKEQTHIHDTYKASLAVSSIAFSGLDNIVIKDLTLQPDGADTFLHVSEAEVSISLINLLRAKVVLGQLKINGAVITIYNEESRDNISFLRSARKRDSSMSTNAASGFREMASGIEAKLFRVLNTAFEAKDIQINYRDSTTNESVYIPSFTYDLHTLSGLVIDQKKH